MSSPVAQRTWRWAKIPGREGWQPIPEDRDQAFVRYDGWGRRMAAVYIPILQCYGPGYDAIEGLTLHGWEQDRWLLAGLDWATWQGIAEDGQSRVTDVVIAEAVAALPPAYARIDGDRLRAHIRSRRDNLVGGARAF